jgi:hypothetical protein
MRFSGPKRSPSCELAVTELGMSSTGGARIVELVDELEASGTTGSLDPSLPKMFIIRAINATSKTTAARTPRALPPGVDRAGGAGAIGIGSELRRDPHRSQ